MVRFSLQNQVLVSFLSLLLVFPVLAHGVEVSGDVAATFHLQPNDQPQAGIPSQAWFALTRRGGKIIPLSQCKCQLAVYSLPRKPGKTLPLIKPPLKPLNVEQYQGIPSAIITFPKPGLYELELTGTAQGNGHFKPFKLSSQVIVTN